MDKVSSVERELHISSGQCLDFGVRHSLIGK